MGLFEEIKFLGGNVPEQTSRAALTPLRTKAARWEISLLRLADRDGVAPDDAHHVRTGAACLLSTMLPIIPLAHLYRRDNGFLLAAVLGKQGIQLAVADDDLIDSIQGSLVAHLGVDAEGVFDNDALNGDAHLPVSRLLYLKLYKA